jgi:hypothetical protein
LANKARQLGKKSPLILAGQYPINSRRRSLANLGRQGGTTASPGSLSNNAHPSRAINARQLGTLTSPLVFGNNNASPNLEQKAPDILGH